MALTVLEAIIDLDNIVVNNIDKIGVICYSEDQRGSTPKKTKEVLYYEHNAMGSISGPGGPEGCHGPALRGKVRPSDPAVAQRVWGARAGCRHLSDPGERGGQGDPPRHQARGGGHLHSGRHADHQ